MLLGLPSGRERAQLSSSRRHHYGTEDIVGGLIQLASLGYDLAGVQAKARTVIGYTMSRSEGSSRSQEGIHVYWRNNLQQDEVVHMSTMDWTRTATCHQVYGDICETLREYRSLS